MTELRTILVYSKAAINTIRKEEELYDEVDSVTDDVTYIDNLSLRLRI